MEYYADDLGRTPTKAKEVSLKAAYPPIVQGGPLAVETNWTIVDNAGNILAWILPAVLSKQRQVPYVVSRPDRYTYSYSGCYAGSFEDLGKHNS